MSHCMVCCRNRAGYNFLPRTIETLEEALELAGKDDVSNECATELRLGIGRMLRQSERRGGSWSEDPWSREETVTKAVFLESTVRVLREALQDAPPGQGVCEECTGDLGGTIMKMIVDDQRRKGPWEKIES